jgi:hypothetical protein
LLKHAQKNKTLNKYLTSKLQFSPNFTLDSVADSNYRGKCDVGGFLIFEWTIWVYKRLCFRFSRTMTTMKAKGENVQIWQTHLFFYNRYKTTNFTIFMRKTFCLWYLIVKLRQKPEKNSPSSLLLHSGLMQMQGVSEIRVLILTHGRACKMKRFFCLNFYEKAFQIEKFGIN